MREVTWQSRDGRSWVALVPDSAPDSAAPQCPQLGPPDVSPVLKARGWTPAMIHAVHDELLALRLFTTRDVRRPGVRANIVAALQRVLRADAQAILDLYRPES